MTKKETLIAIMDGTLDHDALVAFCEKEIAALDRKADKAKERAAEKREAGDALQALVQEALTADFASREDITAKVVDSDPEATVGKVGYRLTALVKAGVAQKADAIVDGAEGKKKKITVYALA
jgi:hypothetical protein